MRIYGIRVYEFEDGHLMRDLCREITQEDAVCGGVVCVVCGIVRGCVRRKSPRDRFACRTSVKLSLSLHTT